MDVQVIRSGRTRASVHRVYKFSCYSPSANRVWRLVKDRESTPYGKYEEFNFSRLIQEKEHEEA